jgi:hypothetical protein
MPTGDSTPIKYPIEKLAIGDSMTVKRPRDNLRGSLHNRANKIGITVRTRTTNHGLVVTRVE